MKKITVIFLIAFCCILLSACNSEESKSKTTAPKSQPATSETAASATTQPITNTTIEPTTQVQESTALQMIIGDTPVSVDWENNVSVQALKELCSNQPLTIQMSMYGGFEQVGDIGSNLPQNDVQTTASSGDIVLYSGNQMVVFYGSNTWAYTRLGHITDKTPREMTELLSGGNVAITISY